MRNYYILIVGKTKQNKNLTMPPAGEYGEHSSALLVVIQNGTVPLENSLAISYEVKHTW